ncbi:hypothetical protein AAFF_G00257580 [Aldrovandia affinis]|uniref:PID domain-containing protein n=1 Tax=Aldrovandia affinis TaxID=143900 RepID=A0AAD7WU37_9TELE|nr:hypothetical protein AAFF_G00257580 [Aldrovandia affinis]
MDTEQDPFRIPVQTRSPIKARRPSKKVPAIEKTPEYLASRFRGDGVRYKAKLIGIDEVPASQGDKMCLDSMMKLKGWEVAGRHQGQHKQRVWLKVSANGVQIIDERTGAVEHEHALEKVSSLKKDHSDPRSFTYIYGHEGTFKLFYIKMGNLADPVMEDITDVCQIVSHVEPVPETPITQNGTSLFVDEQGLEDIDFFAPVPSSPTQNSNQNGTSMLLDEQVATPQKGLEDIDFFAPVPSSPTQNSNQSASHVELLDIFSPSSGTQAPTSPTSPTTPSFNFNQPRVAPFIPSPAAVWSPQGQLRAPYPSFNGPWEATGVWTPQCPQTTSGWGQASLAPKGVPGPLSPGVMPLPGASWGITQPGYPTTAGHFCPPREEFPHLGTPAQPPKQPTLWQGDPAKVTFQVSCPFTSDA